MSSAIAAGQKAGQDQHALGVDRPAELDLALDVDDLAAARPHPAGDAGRAPEAKPPSSTTLRPFTWPMRMPLVSIRAKSCRMSSWTRSRSRDDRRMRSRDGRLDIDARHNGASGFAGAEVGLGEHVVDAVDDERELVGVIRQPGGVFDHQGGRRRDRAA